MSELKQDLPAKPVGQSFRCFSAKLLPHDPVNVNKDTGNLVNNGVLDIGTLSEHTPQHLLDDLNIGKGFFVFGQQLA